MLNIEFDELKWLNTYIEPDNLLDRKDFELLKTFTFMWDMFEAKGCGGVANAKSIVDFVINKLGISEENTGSSVIDAYYRYFNNRYVDQGETNHIFERMTMNAEEIFQIDGKEVSVKEYLRDVLLSNKPTERDRFLATLLVLYRFRNNFFLRTKNLIRVNQQYKNFSLGNQIIATVLNMYKNKK